MMLSTLLQQFTAPHHYGFLGVGGLIGLLIGIAIFVVIVVILFRIVGLLLPKLGLDATWTQVIYWLMVLVVFLVFLHMFGLF